MKVLLTGGQGFVGRHLTRELLDAGFDVLALGRDRLDIEESASVLAVLTSVRPAAVVHLAAVSYGPSAAADPSRALRVTVGGTVNLLEAVARLAVKDRPAVLVTSSSEVYGIPAPGDLSISEAAPLRPRTVYALTKVSQESVALAYAYRHELRLVVARGFNHAGPGQRPDFVVPALAARVVAFAGGEAPDIPVGNLDVRRDFTHVRDVAVAYRLLLEGVVAGTITTPAVFNIASENAVPIRDIVNAFCRFAAVVPRLRVDAELVRPGEALEIRGDASRLREATGWQPVRDMADIVADVWADAKARSVRS